VLGPDGAILHTHVKISRYGDETFVERTRTGRVITVLESPIGNLTVLICRDLFNDTVEPVVTASHANVLLVPSLSPKTSAHETAAEEFRASNAAATFVCNRWIRKGDGKPDGGRTETFSLLPGKSKDGTTTLRFSLARAEDDYLLVTVE